MHHTRESIATWFRNNISRFMGSSLEGMTGDALMEMIEGWDREQNGQRMKLVDSDVEQDVLFDLVYEVSHEVCEAYESQLLNALPEEERDFQLRLIMAISGQEDTISTS